MLDFNTVYKRHGEQFLYSILDQWERDYKVKDETVISLEARWERFLHITDHTNDNMLSSPAAALAVDIS
jgi:hypothetical protein